MIKTTKSCYIISWKIASFAPAPTQFTIIYHPKFCIGIVFNFSWDDYNTQEKLETKALWKIYWGKQGV